MSTLIRHHYRKSDLGLRYLCKKTDISYFRTTIKSTIHTICIFGLNYVLLHRNYVIMLPEIFFMFIKDTKIIFNLIKHSGLVSVFLSLDS